jgi:hypothetical protein
MMGPMGMAGARAAAGAGAGSQSLVRRLRELRSAQPMAVQGANGPTGTVPSPTTTPAGGVMLGRPATIGAPRAAAMQAAPGVSRVPGVTPHTAGDVTMRAGPSMGGEYGGATVGAPSVQPRSPWERGTSLVPAPQMDADGPPRVPTGVPAPPIAPPIAAPSASPSVPTAVPGGRQVTDAAPTVTPPTGGEGGWDSSYDDAIWDQAQERLEAELADRGVDFGTIGGRSLVDFEGRRIAGQQDSAFQREIQRLQLEEGIRTGRVREDQDWLQMLMSGYGNVGGAALDQAGAQAGAAAGGAQSLGSLAELLARYYGSRPGTTPAVPAPTGP